MPLIEIPLQEVSSESITFIKEDGLKKLLEKMSMCFTTNIEKPRVSKKINQEENCENQKDLCDLHCSYHINKILLNYSLKISKK